MGIDIDVATANVAVELTSIDALKAALVRALQAGDAELAAALYAPDARLLPPGAPVITGVAEVLEFFRQRVARGAHEAVLETVRQWQDGDIAVEEGRYGRLVDEDLVDTGKYLVVFRRQDDGTWRYETDIWNSDG
jgi:uncharacterized protein (TIGR02246 family)